MPGIPYPPYGGMFMELGQLGGFNHGQGIVQSQMSGQGSVPAPMIGQGTIQAPVCGHGASPTPPGGEAATTGQDVPETRVDARDWDATQHPIRQSLADSMAIFLANARIQRGIFLWPCRRYVSGMRIKGKSVNSTWP